MDQELLARNEYLAAENRILKAQLKGRLKLSDAERARLGEIGHRLGRNALAEVATVARPDTILAWYRKLVARKFDGSEARRGPGRPRVKLELEQLIVRMAGENRRRLNLGDPAFTNSSGDSHFSFMLRPGPITASGAMIGLWAPWPISGLRFPIKPLTPPATPIAAKYTGLASGTATLWWIANPSSLPVSVFLTIRGQPATC